MRIKNIESLTIAATYIQDFHAGKEKKIKFHFDDALRLPYTWSDIDTAQPGTPTDYQYLLKVSALYL